MPDANKNSARFGINRHFRREALIMAGMFFALLVIALVAAIVGPYVVNFLEPRP